jgi:molybdopterin-guanine dinucleotide biosynthesis protein A
VNKALLEVGGARIIDRILDTLQPLVEECVLLTNDTALEGLDRLRLVFDPVPHAGVLPALSAGLAAARGEVCLAAACDMPFISSRLFEHLLGVLAETGCDVVIPRRAGYLEPMHAVYRREPVATAIQAALERGDQRMISYFRDVHVGEVDEAEWRSVDPLGRAFFNVNTADDLAEARHVASAP